MSNWPVLTSPLVFFVIMAYLSGRAYAACTAFDGATSTPSQTVQVDGKCVYAFSENLQCDDAFARCENRNTRLVHVPQSSYQANLATATGFSQFWIGLRKVSSTWKWRDGATLTSLTTPTRWSSTPSGSNVCAAASNGGQTVWMGQDSTSWYRAICEEGETPTSVAPTTQVSVTTEATTTSPSNGLYLRLPSGAGTASLFSRQEQLTSVLQLSASPSPRGSLTCGRRCVRDLSCVSFSLFTDVILATQCVTYKEDPAGNDVDCSNMKCYAAVTVPAK